ncbi:MAG: hypothetical protein QW403_00590 [Candidatus Aenigmatarchaeota archaeon]
MYATKRKPKTKQTNTKSTMVIKEGVSETKKPVEEPRTIKKRGSKNSKERITKNLVKLISPLSFNSIFKYWDRR